MKDYYFRIATDVSFGVLATDVAVVHCPVKSVCSCRATTKQPCVSRSQSRRNELSLVYFFMVDLDLNFEVDFP